MVFKYGKPTPDDLGRYYFYFILLFVLFGAILVKQLLYSSHNLGQNKWNIWTTPPPISMMPKWRVFVPSRLLHCFGGEGG